MVCTEDVQPVDCPVFPVIACVMRVTQEKDVTSCRARAIMAATLLSAMTTLGVGCRSRVVHTAMLQILDGVAAHTLRSKTSGIDLLAQLATPFLSSPRAEGVMLLAQPLQEGGSLDTLQHELRAL